MAEILLKNIKKIAEKMNNSVRLAAPHYEAIARELYFYAPLDLSGEQLKGYNIFFQNFTNILRHLDQNQGQDDQGKKKAIKPKLIKIPTT